MKESSQVNISQSVKMFSIFTPRYSCEPCAIENTIKRIVAIRTVKIEAKADAEQDRTWTNPLSRDKVVKE
jgi:hypothetical protein